MTKYSGLISHEDLLARLVIDQFFHNRQLNFEEIFLKFINQADFLFHDDQVGAHFSRVVFDYEPMIMNYIHSNELLEFGITNKIIDLQQLIIFIKENLHKHIGKMIKSSPEWEKNLNHLRKCRKQLQEIKQIMTS